MNSTSLEKTVRPRFIYCLRNRLGRSRMTPKWSRKIEIEKIHPDPLLSLRQAVTANGSDFLGTVLTTNYKLRMAEPARQSLCMFERFPRLRAASPEPRVATCNADRSAGALIEPWRR